MVSIGSLESLTDLGLVNGKTSKARTDDKRPAKTDTVEVSTDARQAAAVQQVVSAHSGEEVRKEVVEAARKRIEEGTYRIQSMVYLVASRLSEYV